MHIRENNIATIVSNLAAIVLRLWLPFVSSYMRKQSKSCAMCHQFYPP